MGERLVDDLLEEVNRGHAAQHGGLGGQLDQLCQRTGMVRLGVVKHDIVDVRRVADLFDLGQMVGKEFLFYRLKQHGFFGALDDIRIIGRTVVGIHNNVEGEPIELVGVTRDVTERRKLEDKVFHLAMHDALTDLPNMRFANEFLGQAIQKAVKHGTKIGIMFIDLNRFKPINDTYGHRTGDLLLGHAAEMIKAVLPADAIAARIGGDEFLVIASNINCKDEVARLAEKIIKNLVNPFLYKKEKIVVGASLGMAMYPDDGRQAADLIDLADDAMYNAKKCGDDKYMFVS